MDVTLEPLPSNHIAASSGQPRGQSTCLLTLSLAFPAAENSLPFSLPPCSAVLFAIVIVSGRLSMSEGADATEPAHCGLS